MKTDYFPFGNNPSPSKFWGFYRVFQIFCIDQPIRIVLFYWKKSIGMFWKLAFTYHIYIEIVIPINFMCINSDQTEKKPTRCVKMQNLALAYILHKVWMLNYKVQMLNALHFWSAWCNRVCQNQDCFLLYNLFNQNLF